MLPCRLVEPFRGQEPFLEPERRTAQLYRCSPRSKDKDLERTERLHWWSPYAGCHCKKYIKWSCFFLKRKILLWKYLNKHLTWIQYGKRGKSEKAAQTSPQTEPLGIVRAERDTRPSGFWSGDRQGPKLGPGPCSTPPETRSNDQMSLWSHQLHPLTPFSYKQNKTAVVDN